MSQLPVHYRRFCLLLAALGWPLVAGTARAEEDANLSPIEIRQLIKQLGSRDFELRQEATTALWRAGPAAQAALEDAAANANAEVRLRAARILEDFRYGILPDTPREVVAIIRRYRQGNENAAKAAWRELENRQAVQSMWTLLQNESQYKLRAYLEDRLHDYTIREAPRLVAAERFDDLDLLLPWAARNSDVGARFWAAYLMLQGSIDQEIEIVQHRLEDEPSDADVRLAVYLHRARGDLAEARDQALRLGESLHGLRDRALFDSGDWQRLSEIASKVDLASNTDIEQLGFFAAYHRLADQPERLQRTVDRIREVANLHASIKPHCWEALFLNLQSEQALEVLQDDDPAAACKVLHRTGRIAEAFDAAGVGTTPDERAQWLERLLPELRNRSNQARKRFDTALEIATALVTLGQRDEAHEMLERLRSTLTQQREAARFQALSEAAYRCGHYELAFECATDAIERDSSDAKITESLGKVFPRYSELATSWWYLQSKLGSAGTLPERMDRLRLLLDSNASAELRQRLLSDTFDAIVELTTTEQERASYLETVGRTALLHGDRDLAERCLRQSSEHSAKASVRLADLLAGQQLWSQAAELYEGGWERDSSQLTALYLAGEMRVKAGDEEQGAATMQQARLIPLAAATRYQQLVSGLFRRRYYEEARRQCELIVRTEDWGQEQMFNAANGLGDLLYQEQPLAAADYWERRMLNCLREKWYFTDVYNYVHIPHLVHKTRAAGLLDAGQVDQAIVELRKCEQVWPGNLAAVEEFVPRLDKLGRTDFADELFDSAYANIEQTCRLFPDSALHHNNLAWTAAKCRRRLEEAMVHAQQALALAPDSAQYVDTLGEVYFQQGHVDKAIECARRCVELEPNTKFYQQQLERFQAALQPPE